MVENRIKRTVLGMDPHWWEGEIKLTVDGNVAYISSMGESTAAVAGSIGDDPPALATTERDPGESGRGYLDRVIKAKIQAKRDADPRFAGDRDPCKPLAKAAPATTDPNSFERWL